MRKVLVILILTSAAIAVPGSAAHAGGSWIEFPGGRAVVGETITGVGHFGDGQQASVDAGPWYARLRPDPTSDVAGAGEGTEPRTIDLGLVTIEPSQFYEWKATVTFTVPDVATGAYWVDVRNADGDGVGDLTGGFIVIGHTLLEARLWSVADRAQYQLDHRNRTVRSLRQREEQLDADLADRAATIDRQAERLADVGRQAALLEVDLAARTAVDGQPRAAWPFWLVGLGLVLSVVAAFALGRRSSSPARSGEPSGDANAGDGGEPLVDREPRRAGIG